MPINKNIPIRYYILDQCFSDFSRKYDIQDLLSTVNKAIAKYNYDKEIEIRQLRSDIKNIRDMLPFGIYLDAIKLEGKRCYYRYSERGFSIYKNDLTVEEMQSLFSTIEIFSRYRGLANYTWLEEIISNLEFRFGIKSNQENIISFEQNEELKGLEFLSEIIDATLNHQPLEIHYISFKQKESISVMHPYHVKQFNNRWFLLGMEEHEGVERISNRPLDRIVRISHSKVPFKKNTLVDFNTYFNNIIGVTIPEGAKEETIILRFDLARFPYVVNKPIHRTQETIDEDNGIICIKVIPNNELESRIFSYGPQVEVLSPEWFRKQIAKKIEENYQFYFSVQEKCTGSM